MENFLGLVFGATTYYLIVKFLGKHEKKWKDLLKVSFHFTILVTALTLITEGLIPFVKDHWETRHVEHTQMSGDAVYYEGLEVQSSGTIPLNGYEINYANDNGDIIVFRDHPDLAYYTHEITSGKETWGKAELSIWQKIVGTLIYGRGTKQLAVFISDDGGESWTGKITFTLNEKGNVGIRTTDSSDVSLEHGLETDSTSRDKYTEMKGHEVFLLLFFKIFIGFVFVFYVNAFSKIDASMKWVVRLGTIGGCLFVVVKWALANWIIV
ncbi:hypothetical protein [Halalkalibacterium halodurans]|uniref:Uncharacterized protein n=1 Tax=Halalkalibacterium halodurans TaxID=86665 RepID=A0A0M0KGM7_ALKHA|nr:hypothetical protein [Halalkalibacterium halodurans]MED4161482.1 hypothetical protein [Halalkalibacterium halodurans]TPE68653.1 hypothetical protein AMD02_012645 [Halalkalibacterium halodurans]